MLSVVSRKAESLPLRSTIGGEVMPSHYISLRLDTIETLLEALCYTHGLVLNELKVPVLRAWVNSALSDVNLHYVLGSSQARADLAELLDKRLPKEVSQ
jgi:hypothetical protein